MKFEKAMLPEQAIGARHVISSLCVDNFPACVLTNYEPRQKSLFQIVQATMLSKGRFTNLAAYRGACLGRCCQASGLGISDEFAD